MLCQLIFACSTQYSHREISFYFSINFIHTLRNGLIRISGKVSMIKIKILCGYVEHIEKC